MNRFHYCYGNKEWVSLLLWRKTIVFTTAMETRNEFPLYLRVVQFFSIIAKETNNCLHYCYGDKQWFSLLLWRKRIVFTTAMEKRNGLHYCYGDNKLFSLLLWRQGMVITTAMEKR